MTRLSAIRDSEKNRNILKSYTETPGLEILWGDLNNYDDVLKCVKGCDLILHIAAFVSPAADYYPKQAMKVNYGLPSLISLCALIINALIYGLLSAL